MNIQDIAREQVAASAAGELAAAMKKYGITKDQVSEQARDLLSLHERLGRPRLVVHCKREAHEVYIGRPSRWGNPYVITKERDRAWVLARYRRWLEGEIKAGRLDPRELKGKILGCWCAPKPCHGDILVELSERP